MKFTRKFSALLLGMGCLTLQAQAQDMGKLLATGGVSQVEGAGGGGLTPWALITGYGTQDSIGGNVHYTGIKTQDYSLNTYGVAVGLYDRVELSLAKQSFMGDAAALNGLEIKQDIYGLKVRVAGDAVYDQDRWLPQIAVGVQHKRNQGVTGLGEVSSVTELGAKDENGTDYYISATKILLDQSLLLNGTLRASKANQMGLLGFGGDKNDGYEALFEASAVYLFNRKWAAGVEYRQKSKNLNVDANEDDWKDFFVAYFPTRNVSITAAYVDLGEITILNTTRQKGAYLSLQVGF